MLRVAGSLKTGWVTASLLMGKLKSFRVKNNLAKSLQEYGKLIKTLAILRYATDEQHRRDIGIQLNKGESLHMLRQYLRIARENKIYHRHLEDQANQATCLNLVVNCVIAWNTVYMGEVIKQLQTEGWEISEAELKHISPARYEHINPYGQYRFEIENKLGGKLRPLHQAA